MGDLTNSTVARALAEARALAQTPGHHDLDRAINIVMGRSGQAPGGGTAIFFSGDRNGREAEICRDLLREKGVAAYTYIDTGAGSFADNVAKHYSGIGEDGHIALGNLAAAKMGADAVGETIGFLSPPELGTTNTFYNYELPALSKNLASSTMTQLTLGLQCYIGYQDGVEA